MRDCGSSDAAQLTVIHRVVVFQSFFQDVWTQNADFTHAHTRKLGLDVESEHYGMMRHHHRQDRESLPSP